MHTHTHSSSRPRYTIAVDSIYIFFPFRNRIWCLFEWPFLEFASFANDENNLKRKEKAHPFDAKIQQKPFNLEISN